MIVKVVELVFFQYVFEPVGVHSATLLHISSERLVGRELEGCRGLK
jgi:hypothetical protein